VNLPRMEEGNPPTEMGPSDIARNLKEWVSKFRPVDLESRPRCGEMEMRSHERAREA
jgi:hypothetical protein